MTPPSLMVMTPSLMSSVASGSTSSKYCSPRTYSITFFSSISVLLQVDLLDLTGVEEGRCRPGDVVIETVAEEYLSPLRDRGVDTLVLGCTHYPLLTEVRCRRR